MNRVILTKWYIHKINHKQFQTIFLNTVLFTLISFGDLHPEIQPFKNERWIPSWSTFHHCKLCFHLSLFNWLYLCICRYPTDAVNFSVFRTNYSWRWYGFLINFNLVYLKNTLWLYQFFYSPSTISWRGFR